MQLDLMRARRALAAACALLVSISAANASPAFERLVPRAALLAEIRISAASDGSEEQQIAEHRRLRDDDASVAPRVADARAPLEQSSLVSARPTPRRELPAHGREDRLASRSGCTATTRWCRAHATSTQAP